MCWMCLFFSFTEVLFLAEWWSGSDLRVFTSDESYKHWGKEHALIIMNHTFEVDWLMGWIVADRSQTLGVYKPSWTISKIDRCNIDLYSSTILEFLTNVIMFDNVAISFLQGW